MLKIKKGYNLKIVSVIVSIIFLYYTALYSWPNPKEDTLRVPLNQRDAYQKMSLAAWSEFQHKYGASLLPIEKALDYLEDGRSDTILVLHEGLMTQFISKAKVNRGEIERAELQVLELKKAYRGRKYVLIDTKLSQNPLIGICWVITSRCTLACPKCFALTGLEDGNVEQQKQMIDIIVESGVKKLTFAGGEPLLVPHVIDLIEYAHKKGLITALYTTGIGLTDKVIERLNSGILNHLAIPLEGATPEIHKKTMGDRNPDHFNIVTGLLPKLVNRRFNLEVSTVVNSQNIEALNDLGELLQLYQVPKWKLFQFYPLGRGLHNRTKFEITEQAFLRATEGLLDKFTGMDIDIQVGNPEKQASYFNLGPKGEVYTTIGDRYVSMGNIFEKSPAEIWLDPRFNHERHSARHWRDIQEGRPTTIMLCPLIRIVDESKIDEPLGTSVLAGALKKAFADSIEVSTAHYLVEGGIEKLIERIKREKPQILGLSLSFGAMGFLDQIMSCIQSLPEKDRPLVVLGNILASYNAEYLLNKYPEVIVCIGEGEEAIKGVVNYHNGLITKAEIPAIMYMEEGSIKASHVIPVNLEQAGIPMRDILPHVIRTGGIIYMETARGCPFHCAMCSRQPFLQKGWRGRSIDDIIEDLILVNKAGGEFVNFVDEDLFAGGAARTIKLAKRIIHLKRTRKLSKDLKFGTSVSVRTVYKEGDTLENNAKRLKALKYLKDAGLTYVFIGIESGSSTQLRRYGKSATIPENEKAIKLLEGIGLQAVVAFIMIDPRVTMQELKDNLAFLRRTGKYNKIAYPLKAFMPMKGAPYTAQLIRLGLVDPALYDPDTLAYEYVYEEPLVPKILEHIKEWEESQMLLFWQLKLIFRSSGFGGISESEREIIKQLMADQAEILFDYFEEMVYCKSPEQYVSVDAKYSVRLINCMLMILDDMQEGKLTINKEDFTVIIYNGILREMIRRHFAESSFTVQDVRRKISEEHGIELNESRLSMSFEISEQEGKIAKADADGRYIVIEGFWKQRTVSPGDIPRPAKPVSLGDLRGTVVFFLENHVRINPDGFKQALSKLDGSNKIIVILNPEKDFNAFCVDNKIDPERSFVTSTPQELGLSSSGLEELTILIKGIDNLRCIPLTDSLCGTFETIRKARDQSMVEPLVLQLHCI